MTNQSRIHVERESERLRIAESLASERGKIHIVLFGENVIATSTDLAGRKVTTSHDYQSTLALYRKLGELLVQIAESCEVAPKTLRPEYVDQETPTMPYVPKPGWENED